MFETKELIVQIAANSIVICHFAVIALDLIGAVAVFSNRFELSSLRSWQFAYLAVVFGKSLCLVYIDSCPLTIAENYIWQLGDSVKAYDGSFIEHYFFYISPEVDLEMTYLTLIAGLVAILRVSYDQIIFCSTTSSPPSNH